MVHEHRKKREIKDPALRRQEILNQAMILFTQKGYENTSMRDIARSLNISLGLCYRYFDSKQILFDEAINQYVQKCSDMFIYVFKNSHHDFIGKMEEIYQIMLKEDDVFSYHQFFHQIQNKDLHNELTLRICQKIIPYITEELKNYCQIHHYQIKNINSLVYFLTYGQIGLIANTDMPQQETIQTIKHYVDILIKNECIPE